MNKDDIYGDLPDVNLGDEISKLQQTNKQLLGHIASLEKEVCRLNEELAKMKNVQNTLEVNISELFKTAKTEIERKDRAIADLRRELDDLILRRMDKDAFNLRKRERKCEYEEGEIIETKRSKYDSNTNRYEQQHKHKEDHRKDVYKRDRYGDRRDKYNSTDSYKKSEKDTKDRVYYRSSSRSSSRTRDRHKSRSGSKETKLKKDTKEEKTPKEKENDKSSQRKNESMKNTVRVENEKGVKVATVNTAKTNTGTIERCDKYIDTAKSSKVTKIDTNFNRKDTTLLIIEDERESTTPPLSLLNKFVPKPNTSTKNIEPPSTVAEKSNTPPPRIGAINPPNEINSSANTTNTTPVCDNSLTDTNTPQNEIYTISTVISDSNSRSKTVRRRRCVMTFKD